MIYFIKWLLTEARIKVKLNKTIAEIFLPCFHLNNHCFTVLQPKEINTFWGLWGLQCSPDTQLPFYMSLACLFFNLQQTNAPIFFLYYPLRQQKQHFATLLLKFGTKDSPKIILYIVSGSQKTEYISN